MNKFINRVKVGANKLREKNAEVFDPCLIVSLIFSAIVFGTSFVVLVDSSFIEFAKTIGFSFWMQIPTLLVCYIAGGSSD